MNANALDLAAKLVARFPEVLSGPREFRGEVTLELADCDQVEVQIPALL